MRPPVHLLTIQYLRKSVVYILKCSSSKLYNRLPAAGRDVNSTNDLDMVLRDALVRDAPAGVGSGATRQAMIDEVVNRSTNMPHESTNRDRVPQICLISYWYLTSPIGMSGPIDANVGRCSSPQ